MTLPFSLKMQHLVEKNRKEKFDKLAKKEATHEDCSICNKLTKMVLLR